MNPRPALHSYVLQLSRKLGRLKRQPLPCAVNARRIYVLPTGVGLFFATLVLVMSLGALNYGNNPALLLALLLAGAGLASALSAHLQLSGVMVPPPPANTRMWPASRSFSMSTMYFRYSTWPPW